MLTIYSNFISFYEHSFFSYKYISLNIDHIFYMSLFQYNHKNTPRIDGIRLFRLDNQCNHNHHTFWWYYIADNKNKLIHHNFDRWQSSPFADPTQSR